jgi:anti-sigma factor RsiW
LSCDPERVTGFVDGELDAEARAAVAEHLERCVSCREQAEAERALRARLRSLPPPDLPAGLEARVRARVRRPTSLPRAATRLALPLAACLVLGFWVRGYVPFVAWDLARDHDKCFSHHPVPAKVWSDEARVVTEWFERQDTRLPGLPDRVGDLVLLGARYCPLFGLSFAPHVYYASPTRHASIFVVPQAVRLADRFAGRSHGHSVHLLRLEGETVGIVAESEAEAQALETAVRPVLAASLSRGAFTVAH